MNARSACFPLLRASILGAGSRMGFPAGVKKTSDLCAFNSWAAIAIWVTGIESNKIWRRGQRRLRRSPREYEEASRQAPPGSASGPRRHSPVSAFKLDAREKGAGHNPESG